MGKTILSAITESEGFEPSETLVAPTLSGVLLRPTRTTLLNNKYVIKTEAIFHFCLYDSLRTRTRVTAVKGGVLTSLTKEPWLHR